jgi:phosphopantetheinyl transferase
MSHASDSSTPSSSLASPVVQYICRWYTNINSIPLINKQFFTLSNNAADSTNRIYNKAENQPTEYRDYLQLLPTQDIDRINKFFFLIDAYRAIVGRLLIYKFISIWRNRDETNYKNIVLTTNKYGKPFYSSNNGSDNIEIQFNLSHHGLYVALVGLVTIKSNSSSSFSSSKIIHAVGCDVATVEDSVHSMNKEQDCDLCSLQEVFNDCFTPYEWSIINAKGFEQFSLLWAHKEAFIKAIGMGLSYTLTKFQFKPIHSSSQNNNTVINSNQQISAANLVCSHKIESFNMHQLILPAYDKNSVPLSNILYAVQVIGVDTDCITDPHQYDWHFESYRIDEKHIFVVALAYYQNYPHTSAGSSNASIKLPDAALLKNYGFAVHAAEMEQQQHQQQKKQASLQLLSAQQLKP